jgi:uncharacterized protein (DUF58 family)
MSLTTRGLLLLLVAAPLIAAATWAPILQPVAALYVLACLALFALDWRLAGSLRRFDLARRHDDRLSLNAVNPIHLSLRNRGRRPVTFWVRDEPPDAFEIDAGDAREARVLAGTATGLGAWQASYGVRPLRRGNYQFGDLNLRWLSPLGLLVRQGRLPAAGPVKVYPNLLDVRHYDLLLRRNRLQELGLRHTRMFGEGTEFERLREYQPDDDFRRIDWKATARRHQPIALEYQTERSQNVIAVLDAGRMLQSPVARVAKLDYVVNAVLLLAYVATGKGDKVGLLTFADQVSRYLGPRQGRGQFYRMLELLYAVEAQPVEPDYGRALAYLALKQRKRALIVLFTDLSGGATLGVRALVKHAAVLARRSLLLVVTISDPDVHAAAAQRPHDSTGVYQRVAAEQLLAERQVTLDQLRRQGCLTLDVPANELSIKVINQYLELKGRQRL